MKKTIFAISAMALLLVASASARLDRDAIRQVQDCKLEFNTEYNAMCVGEKLLAKIKRDTRAGNGRKKNIQKIINKLRNKCDEKDHDDIVCVGKEIVKALDISSGAFVPGDGGNGGGGRRGVCKHFLKDINGNSRRVSSQQCTGTMQFLGHASGYDEPTRLCSSMRGIRCCHMSYTGGGPMAVYGTKNGSIYSTGNPDNWATTCR